MCPTAAGHVSVDRLKIEVTVIHKVSEAQALCHRPFTIYTRLLFHEVDVVLEDPRSLLNVYYVV